MPSLLYHQLGSYDFTQSGQQAEVAKMARSRNSTLTTHGNWQAFVGRALVCVGSLFLVSCSTALSEMPKEIGGLPAGTPARPEVAPEYPAVHDMPPSRAAAVLTEEERKKVEAELAAMRAEQARRAKATGLPE